jgi:HEAT repeat protein
MKNDPIVAAMERLSPDDPAGLAKALESKSNLVAAKAARIIGEGLLIGFLPGLSKAFLRFIDKGGDKGCAALIALSRALVVLDCDDADVFRKGIRHFQKEPVWGGSVDTAAEVRANCAMGLANTRNPNRTRDLVTLLADEEWAARAGAARALAAVGSDAAAAVLRFKVLVGDAEPDVFCDALRGLLSLEGAEVLPLAEHYLKSRDEAIRDAAIHALGESGRDDAVEVLKALYDRTTSAEIKATIILALKTSRTEAGMKFVTFVESQSLPE